MKGIILAGGKGTRLSPATEVSSKHLLPVYDKPMIFYPLATLMQIGIRQILFITTPCDQQQFSDLLGDGSKLGISLSYAVQPLPRGVADAYIIAADFVGSDTSCLILGDNLFIGPGVVAQMKRAVVRLQCATIFACSVSDPTGFGIVELDGERAKSIEEKPSTPKTSLAVTGLYLYDARVVDIAATLKPSERGELEITQINQAYLHRGELAVECLGSGCQWIDMGTPERLLAASNLVAELQYHGGIYVGCLEAIAFEHGLIDVARFEALSKSIGRRNRYGAYVASLLDRAKRARSLLC
jgi:glucose-1-phosphate thymidylyltransferase